MAQRASGTVQWLSLILISMAALGCPPRLSPYKCIIAQPALSGIPRLIRQAGASCIPVVPSKQPLCGPVEQRRLEDECEAVDDLDALKGTGFACGPGGQDHQHVCPSLAKRVADVALSNPSKPCGPTACDNREIEIQEESGSATHVVFYDDVGCHSGAPDPKCPDAGHRCYYRVLSVTAVLGGTEK